MKPKNEEERVYTQNRSVECDLLGNREGFMINKSIQVLKNHRKVKINVLKFKKLIHSSKITLKKLVAKIN